MSWFTPFFALKRPPRGPGRSFRFPAPFDAPPRLFPRSVTRFTSYSGSTPPSGIASSLASLPNGLPSNPTRFCDLPCMDILLFSLGNPIVLLPLLFSVTVRTDHLYTVWL